VKQLQELLVDAQARAAEGQALAQVRMLCCLVCACITVSDRECGCGTGAVGSANNSTP
jgi:hypothetical protein